MVTRHMPLSIGLGTFAVLFAFFWVMPDRSSLGSMDMRCYDVFRYAPGEPRDEAALWPPGGKCVLETRAGVVERPRQTPVLEWIGSAVLGLGAAATVLLLQGITRASARRRPDAQQRD